MSNIHIILEPTREVIIPRSSIHSVTKIEDNKVFVWGKRDDLLASLDGELARAYWHYEMSKAEVTITGEPEEWQTDISALCYEQLLSLAELIPQIDRAPTDFDYPIKDIADEQLYGILPTELVLHIQKIGRTGRAKFLVDVARALVHSAVLVEQKDEEISSAIESAFPVLER